MDKEARILRLKAIAYESLSDNEISALLSNIDSDLRREFDGLVGID